MAEKSTLVQIVSRQRDADGEQAHSKETVRARVEETEAGVYVHYDIQGDPAVLHVQQGSVLMERSGQLHTRLLIEPGRSHQGVYETPFGGMALTVQGHRVLTQRDGGRFEVRMRYDVYLDGQLAYENDVSVVLRL